MDVLKRPGKKIRHGGKEIIPGTKFGLKYKSARRHIQEMSAMDEERRPLADIGNILHVNPRTHSSTDEDESSRSTKDKEELKTEDEVTKNYSNILKKRLEITGLLHPDDLIPRRRKKTKEKNAKKTDKKGVSREVCQGRDVVSQVRNKQRLMYEEGAESRVGLERCLHPCAHHHLHPLYSTTCLHHPYPCTSAHLSHHHQPTAYTSAHLSHQHKPTTCSPLNLSLSAGPAMYPLHQTYGASGTPWYRGEEASASSCNTSSQGPSSRRECRLLADGCESECVPSTSDGAHVHDIDKEPHGEIWQGSALDLCEASMSRYSCGSFDGGCSFSCLRPTLPANLHSRALPTITPYPYSPHKKDTLEPPLSGGPFSVGNSHPYTFNEKLVDYSSSFERFATNSPPIPAPQSNVFLHRPSYLDYSQQGTDFSHIVDSSHSLHKLNDSLSAAEYMKEISNEISHSGYGTSLVNGDEAKWVKSQSSGFHDTENNKVNPLQSSSSALPSPGSFRDVDASISGERRREGRPVTPYPDRRTHLDPVYTSCRPSSTHTQYGATTTTTAPPDTCMDSAYQHDIMRATEYEPACDKHTNSVSPDLFVSQDPSSPAPPSQTLQGSHQRVYDTPHRCHRHRLWESQANAQPPWQDESKTSLQNNDPDSTATTQEPNLRFSPKISLTRTEDSYQAGVSGVVRVSTVEGEMVLNPSSWKLAHTFTDLLGRSKVQLVSSDLLDPGVNDTGHPNRVVTSEELLQLFSHTST